MGQIRPVRWVIFMAEKETGGFVMNNRIAIYGFTKEQLSLLLAYMPDGYAFIKYDDAAGSIGANCFCTIRCSEGLDTKSREFLNNFYLDVGKNANEQVIWVDSKTKPPALEGVYYHYFLPPTYHKPVLVESGPGSAMAEPGFA